jgi:hypothetical protein
MEFLYGDSTPSPLTTDYVDFLVKALDCFVPILQAEQRMEQSAGRGRQLQDQAEADVARLRELELAASRAVAALVVNASPDAAVSRCSDAITRATANAVSTATGEVQAALATEIKRIEESAARERARCVKAVEQLLLAHELPGAEIEVEIEDRSGEGSTGEVTSVTSYGVTTVMELAVPASSPFNEPLHVSNVVEALDIQVPSAKGAGWLRKGGRTTTERLGRLQVTAGKFGPRSSRVSLRTETFDEGFDFIHPGGGESASVQAFRITPTDSAPVEFELAGEADLLAVVSFMDKLGAAARQLAAHRKSLVKIELDGAPLENHTQPSLLVQRLIDVMAPTVREIVARSGTDQELVLRLKLGDGRREERYARRADLLKRLEVLPLAHRLTFAPLGLGEVVAPPPPADQVSEEISSRFIVADGSSGPVEPPAPPGPPRAA